LLEFNMGWAEAGHALLYRSKAGGPEVALSFTSPDGREHCAIALRLRRIAEIVAGARRAGMRIAFCRHLSLPRPWMGLFATRMAMAWQRTDDPEAVKPWFLRDSEAVRIIPELYPQEQDFVFDKLGMSAFEGTPLAIAMRDAGLSALAICGIAMEIGIEPTCRHAADLGIVPILIEDACGYGDADAARRSVESLRFMGDTILSNTQDFLSAVARPR
jgi:nicotinamidase-related amidase